jgi:hypothetical protein
MVKISRIKNQTLDYISLNKQKIFLIISFSIIFHQCSLKSSYIEKYKLQVGRNSLLNKQLDSLNSILKLANGEIKFLENRFNDEKAITEQYVQLKMNGLVGRKYSGKVSFLYPKGNLYVQGTLVNGNERGRWEYYNIDKSVNVIYDYPLVCVGSQCCDGTTSSSVGRGTCSWHGGVCAILYEYRKRYLNIGGEPQ